MEKLIKLINEYEKINMCRKFDSFAMHTFENSSWVDSMLEDTVISRRYWFIEWLIKENKIDTRKIDEDRLETIQYSEKERITIYDWLLMLLAIKKNPIIFLTSILR